MERHTEIWEQLTGYALGELSPEVHAGVQAHVDGCAECALEAHELSSALNALALSALPIAPPASLRARVLSSLESPQRPQMVPVTPAAHAGPPTISRSWLAVAAGAVLVLGSLLFFSQQRASDLSGALMAADANNAQLVAEATTVAAQADLAVTILTASDLRRIDLQGFDVSRDASARAYWSATRGLLIVADNLPVPPPGRLYQVWLIGAGTPGPVSAGLIDGRSGRGMLIVPAPAGMTGQSVTVAVTDEPSGGLSAPSGSKHFVGSM